MILFMILHFLAQTRPLFYNDHNCNNRGKRSEDSEILSDSLSMISDSILILNLIVIHVLLMMKERIDPWQVFNYNHCEDALTLTWNWPIYSAEDWNSTWISLHVTAPHFSEGIIVAIYIFKIKKKVSEMITFFVWKLYYTLTIRERLENGKTFFMADLMKSLTSCLQ